MRKVKVKVCGLTRPDDVAFCQAADVEYLGFIMARESPRHILPSEVAAMPKGSAQRVGVFTGSDAAEIKRQAREAAFNLLQLHGGQDIALCRALGPERVIKVIWPERHDRAGLQKEIDRFASVCAYFLFDAGQGGGGTGRGFALERLHGLALPRPWFLAGGLGPENVREAASIKPYALDVNSGVEAAPGVKDVMKIRALLRNMERLRIIYAIR